MQRRKSLWIDNISSVLRKTEVNLLRLQNPYSEDHRSPTYAQEFNFRTPRAEKSRKVNFEREDVFCENREDIGDIKDIELGVKEKLKQQQRVINELFDRFGSIENELSAVEKSKYDWEVNLRNLDIRYKEEFARLETQSNEFIRLEELRRTEEDMKNKSNEKLKKILNEISSLKDLNEEDKNEILRKFEETLRESQKKMVGKSELSKAKQDIKEANEDFTKELERELDSKILALKKGYEKTIKNLDIKLTGSHSFTEGNIEDFNRKISEIEENFTRFKEKEIEINKNLRREIENISWSSQIDEMTKRLKVAEKSLKVLPKALDFDLADFVEKRELEAWQLKYEKLLAEKKNLEIKVFSIEERINFIDSKPVVKKPKLTISKDFNKGLFVKGLEKRKAKLKMLNEIEIEITPTKKIKPKLRVSKNLGFLIKTIKKDTKKKICFCSEISVWAKPKQKTKLCIFKQNNSQISISGKMKPFLSIFKQKNSQISISGKMKPFLSIFKQKNSQIGISGKIKPFLSVRNSENFWVFGRKKGNLGFSTQKDSHLLITNTEKPNKSVFNTEGFSLEIKVQKNKNEDFFAVQEQSSSSEYLRFPNPALPEPKLEQINSKEPKKNDDLLDLNLAEPGFRFSGSEDQKDKIFELKKPDEDLEITDGITELAPSLEITTKIEENFIPFNETSKNIEENPILFDINSIEIEDNPVPSGIYTIKTEDYPSPSNQDTKKIEDYSVNLTSIDIPSVNTETPGKFIPIKVPEVPKTQPSDLLKINDSDINPNISTSLSQNTSTFNSSPNPKINSQILQPLPSIPNRLPIKESPKQFPKLFSSNSSSSDSVKSSIADSFNSSNEILIPNSKTPAIPSAQPADPITELTESFFNDFTEEEIKFCIDVLESLRPPRRRSIHPLFSLKDKRLYLDNQSDSNHEASDDSEQDPNKAKNTNLHKLSSSSQSENSIEIPTNFLATKPQQKSPIYSKNPEFYLNESENSSDSQSNYFDSDESSVDQGLFR